LNMKITRCLQLNHLDPNGEANVGCYIV
jgi:hypothetical protein